MICVPIMARNTEDALEKISRANPLADILEFRLDVMESFRLADMVQVASRPVMVTYRSRKEGGRGSGGHERGVSCLEEAAQMGVDLVDVEYSLPLQDRERILDRKECKVIMSVHLVDQTPGSRGLERILKNLADTGAPIVKIVTRAREPADNLRVMALIPAAREMGVEIIAFCMGPLGRISRIASSLLGAYLTFASLQEGEESADGQISVTEMKKILEVLNT